MAGFSRGQGVPLHMGFHKLGAYTNLNKCIAYPRTLYPTCYMDSLPQLYFTQTSYLDNRCNRPEYTPGRSIPGYIIAYIGQSIPRGIFWPRPIHTPSGHNILRGKNWPRPEYTRVSILGRFNSRCNSGCE